MFCRIIKAHYHHEQDHHFSPEKEDALHTDTKLSFLVRNFPCLFHFDHLFNELTDQCDDEPVEVCYNDGDGQSDAKCSTDTTDAGN